MHVCCHTRVECRSLFDLADYWLRHDVVKWTRFVETTSVWWCHGCVAQPLEPLFTPWVLLEGGRNTKSLKWATYLTYLCFTMTIRRIKNETATPRTAKHLSKSKSYYIGGRLLVIECYTSLTYSNILTGYVPNDMLRTKRVTYQTRFKYQIIHIKTNQPCQHW